jgi:hypothetical protein
MKIRRLALIALPAALGIGALSTALPAHAASTSVVVNGHCSQTSLDNLQLQREDTGKISVDFGVDMARHTAGVAWKVKEYDNGVRFVNTTKLTIADGSFSITRLITPQPGVNKIVAKATNAVTGETCRISASI